VTLGFVHACEQNHRNLSVIGGGKVVQLATGKVVTSQLDPLWVFNFAFGVRGAFDLAGAARAFGEAGRDYVHVLASPSSHAGLPGELAGLGFRLRERQAYRRAAGTGAGAPGLVELGADRAEAFLETWTAAWADREDTAIRVEAVRQRLADPRARAFASADGAGVFLLFDSGPTTQLVHLGVAAAAQGAGVGTRMLALAPGTVPPGRPLWLFTQLDGAGDRTAAAAGWALDHTADDWLLPLDAGRGDG
jgi:GNAT superfamily N-acetyltransferase